MEKWMQNMNVSDDGKRGKNKEQKRGTLKNIKESDEQR